VVLPVTLKTTPLALTFVVPMLCSPVSKKTEAFAAVAVSVLRVATVWVKRTFAPVLRVSGPVPAKLATDTGMAPLKT
jgi:hypothetical protein